MSKLEANTIAPATGTTLTLGETGDTVSVVDSISAVSVTATNSTIAGSNLSNAAFLAGDTSTGLGIDSNEVVSKGNNLLLGVVDAGLDIEFREANTERLRFELDSTPTIKGTGDTSLASTTSLSFLTNTSSEAMRVTSGGNVGIGTTSPSSLLDVMNNARITSSANTNHGLRLEARDSFANDTQSSYVFISSGASGSEPLFSGQGAHLVLEGRKSSSRHIYYKVGDTTTAQHVMLANGNVGIGTLSPAAKLAVAGTATFTGTVTGPTTDTLLVKNSAGSTLKTIRGV